jgi:hypothetical protein
MVCNRPRRTVTTDPKGETAMLKQVIVGADQHQGGAAAIALAMVNLGM